MQFLSINKLGIEDMETERFLREKKILEENGLKITPQRLFILNVLFEKGHITADELVEIAKAKDMSVSVSTIYSILDLFKERGIIRELKIDSSRSIFDITTQGHHHFMCKGCGKVYDVHMELCPTLRQMEVDGHIIEEFHGYFYGVCQSCRKEVKGRG